MAPPRLIQKIRLQCSAKMRHVCVAAKPLTPFPPQTRNSSTPRELAREHIPSQCRTPHQSGTHCRPAALEHWGFSRGGGKELPPHQDAHRYRTSESLNSIVGLWKNLACPDRDFQQTGFLRV